MGAIPGPLTIRHCADRRAQAYSPWLSEMHGTESLAAEISIRRLRRLLRPRRRAMAARPGPLRMSSRISGLCSGWATPEKLELDGDTKAKAAISPLRTKEWWSLVREARLGRLMKETLGSRCSE